MLRVDLTALRAGPVEVAGSIAPGASLFDGCEFRVREAVHVRGRLTEAGPGQYYWQGTLAAHVIATCRRCLRDTEIEVDVDVGVVYTDDAEVDDSAAYMIPDRATVIELDDMVREQMILAVPDYPLCQEDCSGLCAKCGKDLNDGPCDCRPDPDPRWAVLEALKSRGHDKES